MMQLSDVARDFATSQSVFSALGSKLSATMIGGCIDDPAMLELAAGARPGQPLGFLLVACALFLVKDEPETEFARYVPLLAEQPLPAENVFPAFRSFCLDRHEKVSELMRTRTMQMTSVGRCALLLPAFARVASIVGEPLSIIELGCCAALNLMIDRCAYDYGDGRKIGEPSAPVQLRCNLLNPATPLPDHIPRIGKRVGIDLHPVDATNPVEVEWADALLLPEDVELRLQLRAALLERSRVPIRIIEGDALEALPPLLAEMPGPVCILHSQTLYQWPEETKTRLDALLRREGRARPIHLIGMEMAGNLPAGMPQRPREPGEAIPNDLFHSTFRDGERETMVLACCDAFGEWMDWEAAD